jgi:hypothetical protein
MVGNINLDEEEETTKIEWLAGLRIAVEKREIIEGVDGERLNLLLTKTDALCSSEEGLVAIESYKVLNSMERVRIVLAMLMLDHEYRWLPRRVERWLLDILQRVSEGKFQTAFNIIGEIDRYIVKEQTRAVWGKLNKGSAGAKFISVETIASWYQWMLDNICPTSTIGYQASEELFHSLTYQNIHNMDRFLSVRKTHQLQDFHKISWYSNVSDIRRRQCRCCGELGHTTVQTELEPKDDLLITTIKYCPQAWAEGTRGIWIKDWCELEEQEREWALRDIVGADRREWAKQQQAADQTSKADKQERTEERKRVLTNVMKSIHAEYQQLKAEGPKFQHPQEVALPTRQIVVRRLEQLQLKRAQVTMEAKNNEIAPRMKFQDLWKVDPKELSSELVRRAALDDPQGLLK